MQIKIKILNAEINLYFANLKREKVRKTTMGVSQNLWGAVKLAKGLNPDEIPRNLTLGGVAIDENDIAGSFARHFSEKIRLGASKVKIEPNTM